MLADELDKLANEVAALLVYDAFEADQQQLVQNLRAMAQRVRGKVLVPINTIDRSRWRDGLDRWVAEPSPTCGFGPTRAAAVDALQAKLEEEGSPDASRPAKNPG